MKPIIKLLKKYLGHLLELISYQMNQEEYKEVVNAGQLLLNRVEAFFLKKEGNHWGPNKCKRTEFSLDYMYSTKEFRLALNVDRNEQTWGYIEVTIPPPGAQHTNCEYKYWVKTPIIIKFDRHKNAIVADKMILPINEIDIGNLLEIIYNGSPRQDP